QEHGVGDQRDPALVATPLPPQGSLLLAWTDYGLVLDANQSQPDIAAQLAPVPLLRGLPEPPGPAVLIDDFEDGDGAIVEHEGRRGAWLTYNDGSSGGAQSPAPGFSLVPAMPGRDSASAARMTGSGCTSWGAGIGVDLNHDGSSKLPYDATAYAGITFWARASTATNIRFNIADANTDPDGGVCSNCFDHFGVNLTVGPGWQRYTFAWSQLQQEGWGEARPRLDVAQLFALHFQVRPNQSFDLWLDDVAFLPAWSFELIDDLEDGDAQILAQGDRVGAWFTYNDGSGSQSPATGAPNFSPGAPGRESSYAARTNGGGFRSE